MWKTDDHDLLRHVQTSSLTLSNGDTLGGSGETATPCLPFLVPSSGANNKCNLMLFHKTSVESMPTDMHASSGNSSTIKTSLRRCRSLERQHTNYEKFSVDRHPGVDVFGDEEFAIDTYYLSDDELSNVCNGADGYAKDRLLSHYDEDLFFAYDALKRPIKLLHDTGGLLADLEFPDSDISWTPDQDQMSSASPAVSRSTAYTKDNHHNSTCNASTQTWFTGCVTAVEVYHGPTCTHEKTGTATTVE